MLVKKKGSIRKAGGEKKNHNMTSHFDCCVQMSPLSQKDTVQLGKVRVVQRRRQNKLHYTGKEGTDIQITTTWTETSEAVEEM